MEGENKEFLRYVQVRFMKYPQNNKQKKWHEKAQGIVEYALILAFVVGIAAAIFAKGGLAEAVSDAYFQISKTIAYAMDDTKEGHQRFAQSQLEKGLKQAIESGKVVLGNGGWVELDLQKALHKDVKQPVNGGAGGDVKVNDKGYEYFTTLWDAANLKTNQIELDDADKGKWAGVRIEKKGMPITSITSTANQPMWKRMRLKLPIRILRRCRSFSATARLLRHGSRSRKWLPSTWKSCGFDSFVKIM